MRRATAVAGYVLLKPLRVLVTVNVPSCSAVTLIRYAGVCAAPPGPPGPRPARPPHPHGRTWPRRVRRPSRVLQGRSGAARPTRRHRLRTGSTRSATWSESWGAKSAASGGRGAPGVGAGVVRSAAIVAASSTLAMNRAGAFSRPTLYDQCSCHRSSMPDGFLQSGEDLRRAAFARTVVHHHDARTQRLHERGRSRFLEPVVRGQIQIDRADAVGRAHQIELAVPGEIAEIDRAEAAVGEHESRRLTVVRIRVGALVFRLHTRTRRRSDHRRPAG